MPNYLKTPGDYRGDIMHCEVNETPKGSMMMKFIIKLTDAFIEVPEVDENGKETGRKVWEWVDISEHDTVFDRGCEMWLYSANKKKDNEDLLRRLGKLGWEPGREGVTWSKAQIRVKFNKKGYLELDYIGSVGDRQEQARKQVAMDRLQSHFGAKCKALASADNTPF